MRMSQKLPIFGFAWRNNKFNFYEGFMQTYDENSDKGYIFDYPKELQNLHSNLPFLSERKQIDKFQKLMCNLNNTKKYVIHMKDLKHVLDHGLITSSWTSTSRKNYNRFQSASLYEALHRVEHVTKRKGQENFLRTFSS